MSNLEQLRKKFPKLTGVNQQYILGVTIGLKHAQGHLGKTPENKNPDRAGWEKKSGGEPVFRENGRPDRKD
jgi:hypothetical protein